jgi:hypothetical protein
MSTIHLGQRLRHIATQWPEDPLRPKLQLKTFLAALAGHPALSPAAVAATDALHQNRVSGHVSDLCSSVFTAVILKISGSYSANGAEAHLNAAALCPA